MLLSKRVIIPAILVSAASCNSPNHSESKLINGTPLQGNQLRGITAFTSPTMRTLPKNRCSGAWISEYQFLTAAHCLKTDLGDVPTGEIISFLDTQQSDATYQDLNDSPIRYRIAAISTNSIGRKGEPGDRFDDWAIIQLEPVELNEQSFKNTKQTFRKKFDVLAVQSNPKNPSDSSEYFISGTGKDLLISGEPVATCSKITNKCSAPNMNRFAYSPTIERKIHQIDHLELASYEATDENNQRRSNHVYYSRNDLITTPLADESMLRVDRPANANEAEIAPADSGSPLLERVNGGDYEIIGLNKNLEVTYSPATETYSLLENFATFKNGGPGLAEYSELAATTQIFKAPRSVTRGSGIFRVYGHNVKSLEAFYLDAGVEMSLQPTICDLNTDGILATGVDYVCFEVPAVKTVITIFSRTRILKNVEVAVVNSEDDDDDEGDSEGDADGDGVPDANDLCESDPGAVVDSRGCSEGAWRCRQSYDVQTVYNGVPSGVDHKEYSSQTLQTSYAIIVDYIPPQATLDEALAKFAANKPLIEEANQKWLYRRVASVPVNDETFEGTTTGKSCYSNSCAEATAMVHEESSGNYKIEYYNNFGSLTWNDNELSCKDGSDYPILIK